MDPLTENDVHLWRVRLDESAEPLAPVLSDDERRRATRFRFARHRREFIHARGALRYVLSAYVGEHPAALRFRYTGNGKPGLDCDVQFNLSHAEGLALIAVALSPVGVDVEQLDPQFGWEPIAANFFSDDERERLARSPQHARVEAFFRCWTRREAYVKARGFGLGSPDGAHVMDSIIQQDGRAWAVHSLVPAPGYVAAVAMENAVLRSHLFDFADDELAACHQLVPAARDPI